MKYIKIPFFAFLPTVMGSFEAKANLSLPILSLENNFLNAMTETREFLLTGDSILLIGFLLWVGYIVFCFPKDTFKKL
jgi:hypothetical protein